jgi:hypothetical protein
VAVGLEVLAGRAPVVLLVQLVDLLVFQQWLWVAAVVAAPRVQVAREEMVAIVFLLVVMVVMVAPAAQGELVAASYSLKLLRFLIVVPSVRMAPTVRREVLEAQERQGRIVMMVSMMLEAAAVVAQVVRRVAAVQVVQYL